MKGVIDTSFEEGKLEGKTEKEIEMILNSHKAGVDLEVIPRITGKSVDAINTILKKHAT